MIVNCKNWGPIKDISIDTSKPLTIFCGPNNTGKTYISYLLYGLFSNENKNFHTLLGPSLLPKNILEEAISVGYITLTEDLVNSILDTISSSIKEHLITSIFAISKDEALNLFSKASLSLKYEKADLQNLIESKLKLYLEQSREAILSIEKKPNSDKIKIIILGKEESTLHSFGADEIIIQQSLSSFLVSLVLNPENRARMLTVERNSIYTFSKELLLSRMDSAYPTQRYPLAVKNSLMIAEDLQEIQKKRSDFYDFAVQLEENLLNGEVLINENGAILFMPSSTKKNKEFLPIQISSSIVKTMSSLIVYLKHIARRNDLLIIDEPEMNLHPDNQILLTRIFAELVNQGIKLVISTHSDYIIREFNNMIMAGAISNKYKFRYPEEVISYPTSQQLSLKNTEVIYFKPNKSNRKVMGKHLKVTEYGFDVESIDFTIVSQTEMTHYLADILKYGLGDE